ncbi:hypothetical protein [Rubrimonas cliftonensis]|uniref:Uncharacterized protein n=1 Tax=Rubrimonas cliftonensis TaxID=89524 RepID=A0A1H3VEA9_9RHOB|nr:hypothetical protein [Rubrimonas cliftonensis]SDZ73001.1 hypothetical protein SAMN05444370_10112 [Rubrimonas cliftonensis]
MTAAPRYDILEAPGWYVGADGAPPVEVLVSFGRATLTIQRFDETPITHWPIASLVDMPGSAAMTLAPDNAAPERLALQDRDMIEAINALRAAAQAAADAAPKARRPLGPGARWALALLFVGALGAGLWAAAPGAIDAMSAAAPPETRAALGAAAVRAAAGDALCADPAAAAALARLSAALSTAALAQPGAPVRVVVAALPGPDAPARAAPGGWVLARAEALAAAPGPDAFADLLAPAVAEAVSGARTGRALRDSALDALRGLLAGDLDAASLTRAASAALRPPAEPPQDGDAARAVRNALARPALSADDWAALRAGCAEGR